MKFKKYRSIKRDYNVQGYIFFLCRTYSKQPQTVRIKIDDLCAKVGGTHSEELHRVLTSGESVRTVAISTYVSESTLYSLRQRFYEAWTF